MPFNISLHSKKSQDQQTLERARKALQNKTLRKFQASYFLKLAKKTKYHPVILKRAVVSLRGLRQALLYGFQVRTFLHPVRSFTFLYAAIQLQREMLDLFTQLYAESGNRRFLEEVKEARFITPQDVQNIETARAEFIRKHDEVRYPAWLAQ